MEVQNLHYVPVSGYCLNVEEKSAVVPSLTMLRDARNFSKSMLWGKILGTRKDYLIAYGFADDVFKTVKYFYRCAISGCAVANGAHAVWTMAPPGSNSQSLKPAISKKQTPSTSALRAIQRTNTYRCKSQTKAKRWMCVLTFLIAID
jgi:hypothetical protein